MMKVCFRCGLSHEVVDVRAVDLTGHNFFSERIYLCAECMQKLQIFLGDL